MAGIKAEPRYNPGKKRTIDIAPEYGLPGAVRFVSPTDTWDFIEVVPQPDGSLEIRTGGLGQHLTVRPHVSNVISVKAERWS